MLDSPVNRSQADVAVLRDLEAEVVEISITKIRTTFTDRRLVIFHNHSYIHGFDFYYNIMFLYFNLSIFI